jgi:hypothetical protein
MFVSFLQELTITQTRNKYIQCGKCFIRQTATSQNNPQQKTFSLQVLSKGSVWLPQTAVPKWWNWDVHPRLPDCKPFPTAPGCKSGKLSHAGTSPTGSGVPAPPPPTACAHTGRPPGRLPALADPQDPRSHRFPATIARGRSCTWSHIPGRLGCSPRGSVDRGVQFRAAHWRRRQLRWPE